MYNFSGVNQQPRITMTDNRELISDTLIEIIVDHDGNRSKISKSFKRLLSNIDDKNLKKTLSNTPLLVTEATDVRKYYIGSSAFEKAWCQGLGATGPVIEHDGKNKFIVVFNMGNITLLKLENDSESLDAIVSHELGHLFNFKEFNPVKDMQNDPNFNYNEWKEKADKTPEFYADYFCKHTGTSEGLKKVLNKLIENNDVKTKEFTERLTKLGSDEKFKGELKPCVIPS